MPPIAFFLLLILSFFIGSIPFAYLFVRKLKGIDIRTCGSGNVGATNAGRLLGKRLGVLILLLDALKGALPAGIGPLILFFWSDSGRAIVDSWGAGNVGLAMGIAAFFGHCYSPFLGFRAGKGVSTALGCYLAVAPKALLAVLVVCVTIIAVKRIISLASITGAALLPFAILFFYRDEGPWGRFWITAILGVIVIFRHRANVRRLLAGTEGKGPAIIARKIEEPTE